MKLFRKFALMATMVCFICAPSLKAQIVTPRIDASLGFSNGDYKLKHLQDLKGKTIVGYRISASLDIPLTKLFYINTGLAIHSKGSEANVVERSGFTMTSLETRMHYLEIPVQAGIKLNLPSRFFVQLQAGPYLSYSLSGKAYVHEGGIKHTYDLYKGEITDFFKVKGKRFDTGLGLSAVVGRGHCYFLVGADFGLVNTIDDAKNKFSSSNLDMTMKNTSFHLGLGYRF